MAITYPDDFLEVRVSIADPAPNSTAFCAGYDTGAWRATQLADHIFAWLPFAALAQEHQLSFGAHNFHDMLQLAAAHIYNSKKTDSRGELGELLLHIACVKHFNTIPVLCKLILKTSSNDTVKGFDGVHILKAGSSFEIWLGESKFYEDGKHAIRDAVGSVTSHLLPAFLDTEKAMIFGHVSSEVPHRAELLSLFKAQTSKDELMKMAVFPILIAYESDAVSNFSIVAEPYIDSLREEIETLRTYFAERAKQLRLRFQLIFVPLGTKQAVVTRFDQKLAAFL